MKKLVLFFLFVNITVFAQLETQANAAKCEKMLLHSLRSNNDGIVECTVFNLVICSISGRNNLITNPVLKELDVLRYQGNSDEIKRIAGLAFDFLSVDNTDLKLEVKFNYHDKDRLFGVLAKALSKNDLIIAEH